MALVCSPAPMFRPHLALVAVHLPARRSRPPPVPQTETLAHTRQSVMFGQTQLRGRGLPVTICLTPVGEPTTRQCLVPNPLPPRATSRSALVAAPPQRRSPAARPANRTPPKGPLWGKESGARAGQRWAHRGNGTRHRMVVGRMGTSRCRTFAGSTCRHRTVSGSQSQRHVLGKTDGCLRVCGGGHVSACGCARRAGEPTHLPA